MQYEEIKNQIKTEIKNKKRYSEVLERLNKQITIVEKIEKNLQIEKEKLQKLIAEKQNLLNQPLKEEKEEIENE